MKNECICGGLNMTINAVQLAIQHARDVIEEWDAVGFPDWRESQTRYAIIDPIIRALGWDTEDPKECYPEYDLAEGNTRPDYALFGDWGAADIVDIGVAPVVMIEAKALRLDLVDEFVDKLEQYTKEEPRMTEGVAVLTNGGEWRLYGVEGRRKLGNKLIAEIDIMQGNRREAARTLDEFLGRRQWR